MPYLNALVNSNFDRTRFLNLFQDNAGVPITTEDILQGWESVKGLVDDEFVKIAKESPVYVSSRDAKG